MNEINVGKLINFTYDTDTKVLRVVIDIMDDDFKEQIIRDPLLKDKIVFKGNGDVMRIAKLEI